MLIKMTTAPGQELHAAALAHTGGINIEWVSQLWIAKSGLRSPKFCWKIPLNLKYVELYFFVRFWRTSSLSEPRFGFLNMLFTM